MGQREQLAMDLQVGLELVGLGQKHQGYWGQEWDQLNIQDSFQEYHQ